MRLLIFALSFLFVSCKQENPQVLNKSNSIVQKNDIKSKGFLVCNDKLFDAGKIKRGTDINHTFNFTNAGVEDVIILQKTMSCNCTSLTTSKDTIMPKETTNLKVTVDTKDKNLGRSEASITVKTNGSTRFYLLEIVFEIVE